MAPIARLKWRSLIATVLLVPLTAVATAWRCLNYVPELPAMQAVAIAGITSALAASVAPTQTSSRFQLIRQIVQVRRGIGGGAGVIVRSVRSADKVYRTYILTAAHIVDDEKEVQVVDFAYLRQLTVMSQTTYPAQVVDKAREIDVALIVIKTEQPLDRSVELVTENTLAGVNLADEVIVVGCPGLEPPSVTTGAIAVLGRLSLRFNAPIAGGNSGGGIFLRDGRLIGLVTGCKIQGGPGGQPLVVFHLGLGTPTTIVSVWLRATGAGFLVGDAGSSVEGLERRHPG